MEKEARKILWKLEPVTGGFKAEKWRLNKNGASLMKMKFFSEYDDALNWLNKSMVSTVNMLRARGVDYEEDYKKDGAVETWTIKYVSHRTKTQLVMIDYDDYRRLKECASLRGQTIKEAVRRMLDEFC